MLTPRKRQTLGKIPTVKIKGKKVKLFKFQEQTAQKFAYSLFSGKAVPLVIKPGFGRHIIMQRVADLVQPQNIVKFYANKKRTRNLK